MERQRRDVAPEHRDGAAGAEGLDADPDGLGADLEMGAGRLFVDFTTGNLGSYNRLTAGYRFPFGRRAY